MSILSMFDSAKIGGLSYCLVATDRQSTVTGIEISA